MRKNFTIEQRKEIRKSCEEHKDRVCTGSWGLMFDFGRLRQRYEDCNVCALGAYAVDHPVEIENSRNEVIIFAKHFGVHQGTIRSFIHGFDGYDSNINASKFPAAFAFGKSVRREFIEGVK